MPTNFDRYGRTFFIFVNRRRLSMKHVLIMIVALIMVMVPLTGPYGTAAARSMSVKQGLAQWLAPHAANVDDLPPGAENEPLASLARFYEQFGYRTVWTEAEGMLPPGEILMQIMSTIPDAGLLSDDHRPFYSPTLYLSRAIFTGMPSIPRLPPYVRLDMMLTDAMLQTCRHLYRGQIAPEEIYGQWLAWHRPAKIDLAVELARAVSEDRLKSFVESLQPRSRGYRALKTILAHYANIDRSGGWPTIPPGGTLRPGDVGPRIAALRRRLAVTDDEMEILPTVSPDFDELLETAVKKFQRRHGLRADGMVGERTLAELNVPVKSRIATLKLNMERRRWLPDDLGERHILVNIPDFSLVIIEGGKPIDRMRAVVGREDRQTPVMSGRMSYLEFNPYWNIPQKIAREDILPKVVRDPDYLSQHGIRIFDNWDTQADELDPSDIAWETFSESYFPYRLRQDPSRMNALGRIKFMFPNPYSIYIHDTPAKRLFGRRERDFSSGCVRVETPMALALDLLKAQGWDQGRIKAAVAQGKRRTVLLDAPVPVHLVYFTAWVDGNGQVNFRQDVYGRDRQLQAALTQRGTTPLLCVSNETTTGEKAACTTMPIRFISTTDTPLLQPGSAFAESPTAGL